MKKITLFTIFTIILAAGACDKPGPSGSSDSYTWSHIKSNLTGRCYEIATRVDFTGYMGYGFAAMSEIPCEEATFTEAE